jgi:putative hemolysin
MGLDSKEKYIDIRKVFLSKNKQLGLLLPGFLFSYLRRIVHEDEINAFMAQAGHLSGIEFTRAVIKEFNVSINIKGEYNLPENGRCVFASNHTLGGFDGLILMDLIYTKYGDIKFLANDILSNIKNLAVLFLPVNKHGANSKERAVVLDQTFQSDTPVGTFPAGLVSRKIGGKVVDLEWKKSFLTKAVQHKRDIVPIHVSGVNSSFFYNLSNFRKLLGIKANIEMLYLADETFKHRNETITVTFGKPIPYQVFDKRMSLHAWAQELRKFIYVLADNPDAQFFAEK